MENCGIWTLISSNSAVISSETADKKYEQMFAFRLLFNLKISIVRDVKK